jgi:hypothetical protein
MFCKTSFSPPHPQETFAPRHMQALIFALNFAQDLFLHLPSCEFPNRLSLQFNS